MSQSQIPNILSVLTFLPLIGAIILMFLPRPTDLPEAHGHGHGGHGDEEGHGEPAPTVPAPLDPARLLVNSVAIFFAVVEFLLSCALFGAFKGDYSNPLARGMAKNLQFEENVHWIRLGTNWVNYHVGVDGISLLLILLTTFLFLLCVLFSFRIRQRLKEFMVFLLFLEAAIVGVFCALDLVLFYLFFEATLIPMYFLIGIFGHERRVYAAVKFFLYTFAGSIFMLVAIVAVYSITGTFDIVQLTTATAANAKLASFNTTGLLWMFAAFSLAFMIKVPMFPFHTWLPDAHVEAPTAGSVLLAGIMLKMGTYGFLRICIPLFPNQAQTSAWLFIVLSIVGIIYGSIVAAIQPDAKKLVAYSSVAHLGFVILGIFTFTRVGVMGALVQNINHGISTPMLFFLVGMLYERKHTREISQYGGLKKVVPFMATMLLIATLASVAVPFFNGFVGEFPVLLGTWISSITQGLGSFWPAALAGTGMILSAVYMLWWYQRLMLGPITHAENRHLPDLTPTEWAVLLPLAAMVFWFGLGSGYWTQRMDASVNLLIPMAQDKCDTSLPVQEVLFRQNIHELGIRPDSQPQPHTLRERPALPPAAAPPGVRNAPPEAGRLPVRQPESEGSLPPRMNRPNGLPGRPGLPGGPGGEGSPTGPPPGGAGSMGQPIPSNGAFPPQFRGRPGMPGGPGGEGFPGRLPTPGAPSSAVPANRMPTAPPPSNTPGGPTHTRRDTGKPIPIGLRLTENRSGC